MRKVLSEFAAELKVNHGALTGNGVHLARRLETDLGLLYVDGANLPNPQHPLLGPRGRRE